MNVFFNDEQISTSNRTLASIIDEQGLSEKNGIAVALNYSVIEKRLWTSTEVQEDDKILVITATQGG